MNKKQIRNLASRLALFAGDLLMAIAVGAITSYIFMWAYFAVFGGSFYAGVDAAYLLWASYFAHFQSFNVFTDAAMEVVLALISLAPLLPVVVGARIWWMFGRPALRQFIGRLGRIWTPQQGHSRRPR